MGIKRWPVWEAVLAPAWKWLLLIPTALCGLYQEVQQQWMQDWPSSLPVSPLVWLSVTLFLACLLILEGTYRYTRTLYKENPAPNRDTLLRSIADASKAAIDVVENIKELRAHTINTIYFNPNTGLRLEAIQVRFKHFCELLETEMLVAGSAYDSSLKPLLLFIQNAVLLSDSNPQTIATYKGRLESLVIESRNKLDAFSQLTPDNEGS